jgi:glycoside/pentoside/hexuronide:cation symporter, GPH family
MYLIGAVSGLAYGAANQMPRAMLADVNDEELLDHGADRTGMLYALLTGIDKIGFALAVGIAFQVLAAWGYVPSLGEHNQPGAVSAVAWMNCGVTSVLTLCGALLIARYPLTQKRHSEIRRELDRRTSAVTVAA